MSVADETNLQDSGGLQDQESVSDKFGVWMEKLDDWCERVGDRLNPLLVKETRQALKSRQFVVTFSVLLIAALGWTVVGSLMLMPRIYTSPQAQTMLIGYYVALALPMLLVVPLAAYRSLEGEIDDGTLELLEITALSPWQIVLGKLASATLQMLLYFVALFPCVAYAYTLRGVDLPTTLMIMGILFVSGLLLTVLALFFAPIAQGRTGRIITLLGLILLLFIAEWAVGALVVVIIWEGNPMPASYAGYVVFSTVLIAAALCHFLLTVTAAQMTPVSENRSTPIRLSLVMLTTFSVGVIAYGMGVAEGSNEEMYIAPWFILMLPLMAIWAFAGSLMIGESAVITPRIQRELPGTFLTRVLLSLLTPGPTTGYLFAACGLITLCLANCAAAYYVIDHVGGPGGPNGPTYLYMMIIVAPAYMIGFWGVARWLVALVRLRNNPRVEIGFAATVVVMVLAALVPYASQLMWNDYRSFDYSPLQFTNWAWTLGELSESWRGKPLMGVSVALVVVCAMVVFAINLFTIGRRALPMRTATPERVLAEREAKKAAKKPSKAASPFEQPSSPFDDESDD